MKLSKGQQAMIEDGLPASCIISQEDREKSWKENPPKAYNPSYMERGIMMTKEEISLLFNLKDSKERGSASLGCSGHIVEIAVLEKLGYAKKHGFSPTSFYITDAGIKEAMKHKRPEAPKQRELEPEPEKKTSWRSKAAEKAPMAQKAPKPPRISKGEKAKALDLSPICVECGVSSKKRSAALDFLFTKIGKMQTITSVMKAVYGTDKGSPAATDTVIRSLQRDVESGGGKDKYDVLREKNSKGEYSYGVFKK